MLLGLKNTIIAVVITATLGWVYAQYEFRQGIILGKQQQIALQSEADSKLIQMKEELELVVVEGLKNIQIKNTTINNKAIKEVITKEIYKECKLPEEGKVIANEGLKPRRMKK
jgi:hypothetical protein